MMRRIALLGLVAGAAALAATSCSIPADERVTPIGNNDLGPELADPTTTSTSTTTTTTTGPPVTTEPGETTTSTVAPTTLPVPTVNVTVFYSIANSDSMYLLVQPLPGPGPVSLVAIAGLLETPITDLRSSNLNTAVRRGLISQLVFDTDTAVLTVALDSTVFEPMPEEQRQRAIAQVVLTFTSNPAPSAGNIGSVRFTVDDEPISIFSPATNTATEIGEPVLFGDFRSLLGATPDAPSTTSTTSPSGNSAEVPITSDSVPGGG